MYSYNEDDATADMPESNQETENASKKDQKTAITAAAAGTVGLGVAAVAMSKFFEEGDDTDGNNENETVITAVTTPSSPPLIETHSVPVINTENEVGTNLDSKDIASIPTGLPTGSGQTFDEAFAAARAEMGLGHYFQFEGKTYNTYYVKEWEALSLNDKQEFLATVPGSGVTSYDLNHSAIADSSLHTSSENSENFVDDTLGKHNSSSINEAELYEGIIVEDTDPAGPNTDNKSGYVLAELDGEEVVVVDSAVENQTNGRLNPDDTELIDINNNPILDTRVVVDTQNHPLTHAANSDNQITIDEETIIFDQTDSNRMIAGNDSFDLGSEFGNDTDSLDYT